MGAWHSKSNLCWSVATGCSDFTTHNISSKKIFKNCISKNILLTSLSRRCHSIWALAKAQGSQDSFFCNLIDNLSHKNSSKGLLKKTHNFFPKGSTLRGVFSLTHLLWTLEKFWQNQHNTTISFPSLFVFARKQLLQILFFFCMK